mmetsp:Transcript_2357/g.4393  ORF Transcript_2357/g.4393 Transcript_2357/m.4393 type:complete len:200 (-) Transcript_2357:1434-2033(-)
MCLIVTIIATFLAMLFLVILRGKLCLCCRCRCHCPPIAMTRRSIKTRKNIMFFGHYILGTSLKSPHVIHQIKHGYFNSMMTILFSTCPLIQHLQQSSCIDILSSIIMSGIQDRGQIIIINLHTMRYIRTIYNIQPITLDILINDTTLVDGSHHGTILFVIHYIITSKFIGYTCHAPFPPLIHMDDSSCLFDSGIIIIFR